MNNNAISSISTATATRVNANNTALNGIPLSVNNIGNAGLLFTEEYNQRTAVGGEAIRDSYYATNSSGTKTEYARISTNVNTALAGSEAGTMNIQIKTPSGVGNFLSLNGSTSTINPQVSIEMGNRFITNCSSITTPNASNYAPQKIDYLTGNTSTPFQISLDANQRQVYINCGVPDSFTVLQNGTVSQTVVSTCGMNWNTIGYTVIGTQEGYIFYTGDSGNTWNQYSYQFQDSFSVGAYIRQILQNGSQIIVVGDFTKDNAGNTFNYCAVINTDFTNQPFPYTWTNTGTIGFNAPVYCVELAYGYTYFGGQFTSDSGGSVLVSRFACVDSGNYLFPVDNNNNNGFDGDVYAIRNDSSQNNGNIFVGGQFNTFYFASGSSVSAQNLIVWNCQTGTPYATNTYYTPIGLSSGTVRTMEQYSIFVLVGGDFNVGFGYTPYALKFDWNGAGYNITNWDFFPNYPVKQIYNSPNANHIYTVSNQEVWKDSTNLGASPSGSWNFVLYNQFGSGQDWFIPNVSLNPWLVYYYNTSDAITITLNNPVVWNGTTYTNYILLSTKGHSIELIWNNSSNVWYVIGYTLASFS